MDINVVTSVVGAITGLVGGVAGCVALFQTHAGNKLAKDANDLAGKANEIAADANAISQRALAVTADQTVYKWRVEYDGETSTVFLVNDCGNIARDVHVFVRFEDQTIAQARVDKTMPFCKIALESEFFSKQIIKDQSEIDAINSGNGFFFADIGTCRVTVHVTYTTELGSRRNTEIEQGLTDGQRH